MVAHRHRKRDTTDPFGAVTASGITGAKTAASSATATALAVASSSGADTPVAGAANPTLNGITFSDTGLPSSSSTVTPAASTSAASSSSDSSGISLGTVIGACVGTLAGVIFLILVGLWLYRRSDPTKKRRQPNRGIKGDTSPKNWNQLGDDEDRWDGMQKSKEITGVAPMEKLTMFKKSTPSVRTAYTHKTTSEELPPLNFGSHPFAQYHPNLAKELALSTEEPAAPPLVHQKDSVAISWDGDTVGGGSLLTIRSNRMSGAMSPSLDMAIPTPALTSSEPHRWESAEVVHIEGQTAEIEDADSNNPFMHPVERRKSQNNPFFNAQSAIPSAPVPKTNKGKGREITPRSNNPFADASEADEVDDAVGTPTRPAFSHAAVDSVTSVSSNDRAIQSLIAALGTTPQDIEDRLRVAQTEPSTCGTADSLYTTADSDSEDDGADDEDVTESFPLPPASLKSAYSS